MKLIATEFDPAPAAGWQAQLRDAIRTPAALAAAIGVPADALPHSAAADKDFPLLVPRAFAARMRPGDLQDPLLRQVLSGPEEMRTVAGFSADPVGEVRHYGGRPGVLQKYRGRALLVLTGQCAVNCRYCFRRHYPYSDHALSSAQRRELIDELLAGSELRELILSGGDPLLLPDAQLTAIARQIAARARGITLRIHTRLPIVIPERVSEGFLAALALKQLPVVIVLHANHPQEIDDTVHRAIRRCRDAGFTVLNQAVLLKGINDDAGTLARLSDELFRAGALPYYLHMLDKVAGAQHFDVPEPRARKLMAELAAMRPGYLVPKLVREVPTRGSKQELAPDYIALDQAEDTNTA